MKSPSPPARKRIAKGKYLLLSVVFHVLFALIAIVLVVQVITPRRKSTFTAAPPSQASKPVEHAVKMAQKRKTMSAPAPAKRITTSGLAKVVLPAMPEMPAKANDAPAAVVGRGGMGLGNELAGSAGAGSGGGGGMPFFGLRDSTNGLEGHFYDFKKDRDGAATGMKAGDYAAFLKSFAAGAWLIPARYKYKASPTTLYSKFFFFPAIKDSEAGNAFRTPEAGAGFWIAHYKGAFLVPETGTYRLVGFGDNVLIVKVGTTLALDASDKGYTGRTRTEAGGVEFPGKKTATPVFFGTWLTLNKGQTFPIEVIVGDEGGIFCAGLFLQKKDQPFQQDAAGLPRLPLLFVGAPTAAEKTALSKYLPAESLAGPCFLSQKRASTFP